MSRLDSFIRRLQAQRSILDSATKELAERPGVVLELGLGNGRTYDHLRQRLPKHRIIAFDRQLAAHPDCIPKEGDLVLGDLYETLPKALVALAGYVVMVHSDIGSGDAATTRALAEFLSKMLSPALCAGALVLSDQPLTLAGATPLLPPLGVAEDRYFIYRKG